MVDDLSANKILYAFIKGNFILVRLGSNARVKKSTNATFPLFTVLFKFDDQKEINIKMMK